MGAELTVPHAARLRYTEPRTRRMPLGRALARRSQNGNKRLLRRHQRVGSGNPWRTYARWLLTPVCAHPSRLCCKRNADGEHRRGCSNHFSSIHSANSDRIKYDAAGRWAASPSRPHAAGRWAANPSRLRAAGRWAASPSPRHAAGTSVGNPSKQKRSWRLHSRRPKRLDLPSS